MSDGAAVAYGEREMEEIEDWPTAEVAHARQTPSELGLPSINRNFED